jgi:hypothetical protein
MKQRQQHRERWVGALVGTPVPRRLIWWGGRSRFGGAPGERYWQLVPEPTSCRWTGRSPTARGRRRGVVPAEFRSEWTAGSRRPVTRMATVTLPGGRYTCVAWQLSLPAARTRYEAHAVPDRRVAGGQDEGLPPSAERGCAVSPDDAISPRRPTHAHRAARHGQIPTIAVQCPLHRAIRHRTGHAVDWAWFPPGIQGAECRTRREGAPDVQVSAADGDVRVSLSA